MRVHNACTYRKCNCFLEASGITTGRVACLLSSREAAGSNTDLGDNYDKFSLFLSVGILQCSAFNCSTISVFFQRLIIFSNHEYYVRCPSFVVPSLLSFQFSKQSILYWSSSSLNQF